MTDSKHFTSLPRDEICGDLFTRVTSYYDAIEHNGRMALWRKAHRYYFSLNAQGAHEAREIQRGGAEQELSLLKANHYRNLLTHLHVLVTQTRPAFECRAINTDYESKIQTELGRNILEYYVRERRLDAHYAQACEYALVYSEAYLELEWDKNAGDAVSGGSDADGNATDEIIKSGDIRVRVYDPLNVIRSVRSTQGIKQDWYILRRWESKYDLVATHPAQADEILNYSEDTPNERMFYYSYGMNETKDDDLLPVYTLYHERTPACPNGKCVKFLGPDMCLDYGDLEYPDLPVYPMMPQTQHGTSFGYTVGFDLLCVQEAIDMLYSTILTNQATFGVQNIWMKPGSTLIPNQLGGGLNILESMDKPEPINLTHTPPEIFNFLKGLETLGEVLSGINSVARGQPEASLKSGSALALVASQAVQFTNGLQSAHVRMQEDSATGILRMLQTKAALPRATVVAGKDNQSYMKDFSGKDLGSINRVIIDMTNPMSQTISGRIEMAKDMLQTGATAEQYQEVINTGRLNPITDIKRKEALTITAENEALQDGRPVTALATDMHIQHIQEHKSVLGGTEERQNQDLVKRVLDHIQEHIGLLRTTDAGLLNALGQAPIAPLPSVQPPSGPQGANAPQTGQHGPPPGPGGGGPGGPPPAQPNGTPVPQPGQKVPPPMGAPAEVAGHMPHLPPPAPTGGNSAA